MDAKVQRIDLSDTSVASQVLVLQQAAYRVEADLIGFDGIPPLHESIEALIAAPLVWMGIESGGQIVAAIGITKETDSIDIDRLMVNPAVSRQGYGRALLSVLDPGATITVSTGTRNRPARRLYEAAGFVTVGESSPVAGLQITHLRREGTR